MQHIISGWCQHLHTHSPHPPIHTHHLTNVTQSDLESGGCQHTYAHTRSHTHSHAHTYTHSHSNTQILIRPADTGTPTHNHPHPPTTTHKTKITDHEI